MTSKLFYATLFALLIACNKKVEEPPPAQVNLPPAPKPSASAAAAPLVDLESLRTEEEYEVEAEKEITVKNLEKKVDELEKEIAPK